MSRRRLQIAVFLISIASIAIVVIAVGSLPTASPAWWILLISAAIGQSSVILLWPRQACSDAEFNTLRTTLARRHSSTRTVCDHLSRGVARTFFELRQENERLVFCFGDLARIEGEVAHPLPDSWLLGLELPDQSNRRAIVIVCGRESKILWESQSPLKLARTPGLFLDDARITGGAWHLTTGSATVTADLAVSGSLRGGRFYTYFKELQMFSDENWRS